VGKEGRGNNMRNLYSTKESAWQGTVVKGHAAFKMRRCSTLITESWTSTYA